MAVAFDAKSTLVLAVAINANSFTDFAALLTVGASASFLLAGIEVESSTGSITAVAWDQAGTPQSMTQIGTVLALTGGNQPALISLWGLVNPTAGSKTLRVTASGLTGARDAYVFGVSFTGTATSSVAAATKGFASNNATSTTLSVTTAVSIAATEMAVAYGIDTQSGFNNATTETMGGTQIGENQGGNNNGCAAYFTGSGSTVTASSTQAGTDIWGAVIVGITTPSGGNPFVSNITGLPPVYSIPWRMDETWVDQGLSILPKLTVLPLNLHSNIRFYDLPPRDYTPKLSDYGFTDDTNTILPIPTVLPTPLRTQSTALPPPPVTWYQHWQDVGNSQLPFPTPFYPDIYNQWPNPPPVTWYQSWTQSFTLTNPTYQHDWPNPQPITWYQSWVQQGIRTFVQSPFVQSDWPNPQPIYWNLSWTEQGNSNLPTPTVLNTFRQSDWPNPQPIVWYKDWSQNLLENTLFQVFKPFVQSDWPLPRTYPPIDQFWSNDLNILPKPTPFFQNVDFPLPVVSQPIDQTWVQNLVNILLSTKPPNAQFDWPLTRAPQPIDQTWIQNLAEFYQANTFPFRQSNYPNPPPVYWYEDHNQNLVIYLPVGLKPTNQSDWPLTVAPQPIDQFYYQALALNLPPGPPPPVIQAFAGRQITPEEALRSWMSAIGAKGRVSRYGKL